MLTSSQGSHVFPSAWGHSAAVLMTDAFFIRPPSRCQRSTSLFASSAAMLTMRCCCSQCRAEVCGSQAYANLCTAFTQLEGAVDCTRLACVCGPGGGERGGGGGGSGPSGKGALVLASRRIMFQCQHQPGATMWSIASVSGTFSLCFRKLSQIHQLVVYGLGSLEAGNVTPRYQVRPNEPRPGTLCVDGTSMDGRHQLIIASIC